VRGSNAFTGFIALSWVGTAKNGFDGIPFVIIVTAESVDAPRVALWAGRLCVPSFPSSIEAAPFTGCREAAHALSPTKLHAFSSEQPRGDMYGRVGKVARLSCLLRRLHVALALVHVIDLHLGLLHCPFPG